MLLSLLVITICDAGTLQVHITNTLERGQALTVHCKSKDDDLGVRQLGPSQSFMFSFTPRFLFGSTLYFCKFSWAGGSRWFDIYDQGRESSHRCIDQKYFWKIYQDGPCLDVCKGRREGDCFPWNKE
ncbi:hypothetical protein Tsubulata_041543 [Turnera subulata]|uniref:S-protein homolog n=1 Tax=Turnera subulata TaxID=218843 RepID=A0A9Q0FPE7_9ROSI|nr:hypothetical protein Tsubulata_041543 [Turnera subulata]